MDYRTGHSTPITEYSLAHSLVRWQTALHEQLGHNDIYAFEKYRCLASVG